MCRIIYFKVFSLENISIHDYEKDGVCTFYCSNYSVRILFDTRPLKGRNKGGYYPVCIQIFTRFFIILFSRVSLKIACNHLSRNRSQLVGKNSGNVRSLFST